MTMPAAREARIHRFYSGWQRTPLKIRALLPKRKENGRGSRRLALCHNMSPLPLVPFQCRPLCVLLVGGLKLRHAEWVVCGPAAPASRGNVLEMRTLSPLPTCLS